MTKKTRGWAFAILCSCVVFIGACAPESPGTSASVSTSTTTTEKRMAEREPSTTTTEERTTTTVLHSAWGTSVEVDGLRITVDEPVVNEDFVVKWQEDVWYDSVLLVPVTIEGLEPEGGYLDVDMHFGLVAGTADESPEDQSAQPPMELDASNFPEYEPLTSARFGPGTQKHGWLIFGRNGSDAFRAVEYLDGWFEGSYEWQLYWLD